MLRHLCGIHSWASGSCEHGPLSPEEEAKPLFATNAPQFAALQALVTSPKLLRQFPFYVDFM